MEDRLLLTVFTVINTTDTANPGSLRWAIGKVNADLLDSAAKPDSIAFDIPRSDPGFVAATGLWTISPTSALPAVTNPVTIDGTTQTGYVATPLVELNGTNAGAASDGLDLSATKISVLGLAIDKFGAAGIKLLAPGGDTIQADDIGIDPTGTTALGNGGDGVLVTINSNANQILNNVISGNVGNGINLNGSQFGIPVPATTGNVVHGNFIGTNAAGTASVANQVDGVRVLDAPQSLIGGTTAATRNIISGNNEGMELFQGSDNTLIEGNYIGTDVTGTKAIGNGTSGILRGGGIGLEGISNTTFGGTAVGAGNVISGNAGFGVDSFVIGSSNLTFQGNLVGTDVTGTKALGNGRAGIYIGGPSNVTIGGTGRGAANVISANVGAGITTFGSGPGLTIQGNFIGTDITGTRPLGNGSVGINATFPNITIGGLAAGAGNVIAYNGGTDPFAKAGVLATTSPIPILSNSIFSNTVLGIDLNNGAGNKNQPAPGLTSANLTGTTSTIVGSLTAAVNTAYTIQFFSNTGVDAAGDVEGQTFIGTATVTTGATGTAPINVTLPATLLPGLQITATATDPLGNTSEFSAPVQTNGSADLSAGLMASAATVQVGDFLTYTLTITNSGPTEAVAVVATDTLPAGVTYLSASSTVQGAPPTQANGVVTAQLGTMAANSTATITILVKTTVASAPSITDTATVRSQEPDPMPTNNTASLTTTVTPLADLSVALKGPLAGVQVGQDITYTATVTNAGPSPATGVTLTDTLPTGVTFVSARTSTGRAPTQSNGVVTGDYGLLAAGASATITIVVGLDAGSVPQITDSATVSANETDPNMGNNNTSVNTTVSPVADVSVSITPDSSTVQVGQQLTYTVAVTNNGPSPATGVTLTDALPASATFDSANASAGPNPTEAGGVVTDAIGNLAAGATINVSIVVTPTAGAVPSLFDSARVTSIESDPDATNNTDNATTTVTPVADVSIVSITPTPGTVQVGQDVSYTVVVANNGPSAATGATITDTLPAGLTYVSSRSTSGSASQSNGTVTATLGTLASDGTATLTIVAQATAGASASVTDSATIAANETDPTPGNNTAGAMIDVTPVADLVLSVVAGPSQVNVLQPLTYTVTVTNAGPSPATGVIVTDTLPTGVTYVSSTFPAGASPIQAGGAVVAQLDTLAPDASATLTIVVTPGVADLGTITDNAVATADEVSPNPNDGIGSTTTTVNPVADLSLAMTASAPQVLTGGELIYTLVVTNNGPSPATNVKLTDPLFFGATFDPTKSSAGATLSNTGTVADALGTLAPGASTTVRIAVIPAFAGSATNTASVQADQNDSDSSNNAANVTTNVAVPVADLSVEVTASAGQVTTGDELVYTIVVTNAGPQPATNVTLTDPLFAAATFDPAKSSPGAAISNTGAVTSALGTLAPNASATVTIAVIPAAAGTFTNTASVQADQSDPNLADNSAGPTTDVVTPPGALAFGLSSYTALETDGTATITIDRTGGSHGDVTVLLATTSGGNAIPGVDFQPVSIVVDFPDGVTSQTVNIPVLFDPFENQDKVVNLTLGDPTGGAALGTPTTATLTIVDTSPDVIGPQVADLRLIGPANAITALTFTFTTPLNPTTATDVNNYVIIGPGATKASGSRLIPVSEAIYDPSTLTVMVIPSIPLRANVFYLVSANGTTAGAIADLAGNPLNSVFGVTPGSDHASLVARGTQLQYADEKGNAVSLKITGGGVLDVDRTLGGQARRLQVLGTNGRRTVVSGAVRPGGATTTFHEILGLGQFGSIGNRLFTPPFYSDIAPYPNSSSLVHPPAVDTLLARTKVVKAARHPQGPKAQSVHKAPPHRHH